MQFTCINVTRLTVGKKCLNLVFTELQMGILVTFTFCIVPSEITETADAVTKTGLLILAEIGRGELITEIAVTGTGTS